jgi:predicted outer membrane repeat protein
MWLESLEDRLLPSTLNVTNLLDSGPGSLRAEIAAAAAGDTIVLDSSLSGQITLTSGELDITHNLTIQGPGAATLTVSGNNAQRVFHILPSVSATISGLTIANGSVPDFGAGIESEGSLTLLNSTLTNNSAGQGGGGVSFVVNNTGAASLTVSGSTFTNNTAPNGAGIFSSVTNSSGLVAVAVSGTDFGQNTATGAGGAIDSFDVLSGTANATFSVSGGHFSNNTAQNGGAISTTLRTADASQGTVTLSGASITTNTALQNGGGVFSELTGSGSSQATITFGGDNLDGNTAGGLGGGLDSTVTSSDSARVSLQMTSGNFVGDGTAQVGGGIASRVTVNGSGTAQAAFSSNISFNSASFSGGGLFSVVSDNGAGTATVTLSGFDAFANQATGGQGGGVFSTVTASGSGPASFNVSNAFISDNIAGGSGAGLFDQVLSLAGGAVSTSVASSFLTDNNAPSGFGSGGGAFLSVVAQNSGSATGTFSGDTITGNTVQENGGGVNASASSSGSGAASLSITNTTVNGNTAGNVGGGILVSVSAQRSAPVSATLSGDTVSGNTAQFSSGGGIDGFVSSLSSGPAALTVTGTSISGNTAGASGGGLSLSSFSSSTGSANLTLSNETISGNTAGSAGGIDLSVDDSFNVGQAVATLSNLTVTGNSATATFFGGQGGGIRLFLDSSGFGPAAVNVSGTQVSNNQAGTDGGGIYASISSDRVGSAALNIDTSTISGNTAANRGGGLFGLVGAGGPSTRTVASVTVTRSTVSGNSAGDTGGGGYFDLSNSGQGAAARASLTASTVSGNSAVNQGGGVYAQERAATNTTAVLTLTNSTVFGNSASLGAGLLNNTLTTTGTVGATLLSDTVAFNSASTSGGGLDAVGGAFVVRSTLVAANTAGTGADAFGTFNSAGHNLVGQTDGSSGWVKTDLTGTAASPLDPLFDTFGNNGGPTSTLALLTGSPAIGQGDPAGPATDQRGLPRDPVAPTIGAFEPQIPASFQITAGFTSIPQGVAFSVTVSALGRGGQVLTGFTGSVHFAGSDGSATLPPDFTFTGADAGRHTFSGVILQTLGSQTITVTGDGASGTLTMTVVPPLGTWTPLTNLDPGLGGTMLLLTDGTVLVHGSGNSFSGNTWFKLTPDASGSYVNGTWTQVASMNLGRLFYPSNVLPDGRLFVVGGEFSGNTQANFTNTAEIYDPVANTWTSVANFPQANFGDDPTALLPDGRVLAGYVIGAQTYIFDPKANTWTFAANKLRNERSDEESWVTLPDGSILSYDVFNNGHAQRYVPSLNQWVDAGTVPVSLSDGHEEMGPGFLLPDGRAFFLGDNGNTAYYTPSTNTWAAGPVIPEGMAMDDAPGAMMPNGHILFAADKPIFNGPTNYFEFDPVAGTMTPVLNGPANNVPAFTGRMLMLPNGQVLFANGGNQLFVYTPSGATVAAGVPTISGVSPNSDGSFTLSGTGLNGISEGAAYGDDAEMSTNYPLVRLTNTAGQVFYARTFNWNVGVATGSKPVSTQFTLPAGIAAGTYSLVVVANGIPSAPVSFTVASGSPHALALQPGAASAIPQVVSGSQAGSPTDVAPAILLAGAGSGAAENVAGRSASSPTISAPATGDPTQPQGAAANGPAAPPSDSPTGVVAVTPHVAALDDLFADLPRFLQGSI